VSLTIVDDLDWSAEQEHLMLLQNKLNAYLAFVESGEVFDRLAEEVGRKVPRSTPVKVSILAKCDVTPRAQAFLEHAVDAFRKTGVTLAHRVVKAS